jgi:hypothetical protein
VGKVNFIVSSIRDFRIDNIHDKYFLDPYDYHLFSTDAKAIPMLSPRGEAAMLLR